MLFLFENTLTPYIYSVFFTLISRAQSSQSGQLLRYEQTRHTDRHTLAMICAALRHEQPRKNGISVRNDRHTIGYDPGNLHAMSNHNKNGIRAHTPTATPSPRPARAYSC